MSHRLFNLIVWVFAAIVIVGLGLGLVNSAKAEPVTPETAPQTVMFDGCEGKLVPGTNYYNFVKPGCKTYSRTHSSSPGEDKRAEQEKSK